LLGRSGRDSFGHHANPVTLRRRRRPLVHCFVRADALDAHRAAPHFKELGRKLGDYLAGRPDVQVMQEV